MGDVAIDPKGMLTATIHAIGRIKFRVSSTDMRRALRGERGAEWGRAEQANVFRGADIFPRHASQHDGIQPSMSKREF